MNDKDLYDSVASTLRTYPKWACVIDNVWIVCTDDKLVDIREKISNSISGNGVVMVMDISGDAWGTYSVSREVTDWMKTNV